MDSLKTSSQFRKTAEKNQNKELVILKGGKAVSSHSPCCLIRDGCLIVKFVKAHGKMTNPVGRCGRRVRPDKLVTFHVQTEGGSKIIKVMKNPLLKKIAREIIVYAHKGEKVKQALRRDGRFEENIFKKNFALSDISTEVNTEMSSLVDALEGKTFKIVLLDQCPAPESQPGSLDDAEYSPEPLSATQAVSENPSQNKPNDTTDETIREIPNSKEMQGRLFSQFQEGVKQVKAPKVSRRSRYHTLLHAEYGKSAQACSEVKTMKTLMHLGDSVCQVRIKGRPVGSGFLLFDRFVLTNAHVVREIYDENTGQLRETITVHFSFESLNEQEPGVEVEEIVGYEDSVDVSGRHDWALLQLRPDQTLPDGLLKHFHFLPSSGGICIIGHPEGGVKRHDPCFIVPSHWREKIVDKHSSENPDGVRVNNTDYSENINLVTHNFFNDIRNTLTYESCFFFGSSGSPVFDKHCNVVAMHSGGYFYQNRSSQYRSVIEYGHPLSDILERMVIQIVSKGKWDVFKEYLAFNYAQQKHVMANVKKLVESRNLVAFKNAINNSAVSSDERFKVFFEFFQPEEPFAMETD